MLDEGKSVSDVADAHFGHFLRYRQSINAYCEMKSVKRDFATEVIVLWGDTGTGKTRYAYEQGATPVFFDKGGFIHGFEGQEKLIFDDFDPDMLSRSRFLTLTDRYPCVVNVKGGSRNWAPKVIYITSNHDPRSWYNRCAAVRRRYSEIRHFRAPLKPGSGSGDDEEAVLAEVGDRYDL